MSKNQDLTLTAPVSKKQVSRVIKEVETRLDVPTQWRGGRQSWGWSSRVDVSITDDYIHPGRKVIDFHWVGKSDHNFPETFREVALEQGLPVGELRKISY